ncbi:MAG: hypothetical protein IPF54_28105 [Draconibacterium sp.]|nr:hypothetical protein [Draconibacterium sp.]
MNSGKLFASSKRRIFQATINHTNSETGLSLMVRYWGAVEGKPEIRHFIDNEKLLIEDNTGRWNP